MATQTKSDELGGWVQLALKHGISGSGAMAIQVFTMMWLRTTINYQYFTGLSTMDSFKRLYAEGGVLRFYRGLPFALCQASLVRFGDTSVNAAVVNMKITLPGGGEAPMFITTGIGSALAAGWRLFCLPVDSAKTHFQVHGKQGLSALSAAIQTHGVRALWQGGLAATNTKFITHYPYWFTNNLLSSRIKRTDAQGWRKHLQSAKIGICCSLMSDCCSNWVRVMKTQKQLSTSDEGYLSIAKRIVKGDGVLGFVTRGLGTRLLSNGVQSMLFMVLWRHAIDVFHEREQRQIQEKDSRREND